MVKISENHPQKSGAAEELPYIAFLTRELCRHAELQWVASPFQGLCFQFVPEDIDVRLGRKNWYIPVLNRALYETVKGTPHLFYQDTGKEFIFRISFSFEQPDLRSFNMLLQKLVETGRETDAAMRAAAFSH